jgi:starch synthase
VVRATGGLDETIQEFDPETGNGNGFKFSGYTPTEMLGAVQRALAAYHNRPVWETLMRKNMALDFSWLNTAGPKYLELFRLRVLGG